jgi:hypothetical protein
MAGRTVVLICGPPGAGKTTKAKRLEADDGLQVFDLDDPEWGGSQKNFNAALRQIGTDPAARAVVIRAGATLSARQKAADMVGATTVEVLAVDAETCRKRIVERKRERPSLRTQIAAVRFWWQNYEPGAIFLGPLSPSFFIPPKSEIGKGEPQHDRPRLRPRASEAAETLGEGGSEGDRHLPPLRSHDRARRIVGSRPRRPRPAAIRRPRTRGLQPGDGGARKGAAVEEVVSAWRWRR